MEVSCQEEYIFPQLLMQWLQKNSRFDGIDYQGASSNPAQRSLYIGNLALPARNISPENEYAPCLKRCFKLSEPKEKDFNSDKMVQKIKVFEKNYLVCFPFFRNLWNKINRNLQN